MFVKRFYVVCVVVLSVFCASAGQIFANELPKFGMPVECTLGQDCLIVNYVDQVEGAKHGDYECNSKTYEGHKGVDFAVSNYRDLQRGVPVVAALNGKVLRVRDGEDDSIKDNAGYDAIKRAGKECGNGVLVEHKGGWQSFYCHLKQNSIVVKPGETVKQGQVIAQIGQSGWSEFPHLHFSILKNSLYVDPFTGLTHETGCGLEQETLWQDPMPYSPFALFDGGFAQAVPDFSALRRGEIEPVRNIAQSSEALVYWTGLYHSREGDHVTMRIHAPDGELYHERRFVIEKNKKRAHYYYAGRKTRKAPLKQGIYKGETILVRKDENNKILYEQKYDHMIHVK